MTRLPTKHSPEYDQSRMLRRLLDQLNRQEQQADSGGPARRVREFEDTAATTDALTITESTSDGWTVGTSAVGFTTV